LVLKKRSDASKVRSLLPPIQTAHPYFERLNAAIIDERVVLRCEDRKDGMQQ
jgi:hypothetical protein